MKKNFLPFAFVIMLFSLTSMTAPALKTKKLSKTVAAHDQLPQPGDNISGLTGLIQSVQDKQDLMSRVDLPESTKANILAGRLCVFLYNPDPYANLCRYLVIYDCNTGTIYMVTWVP